MVNCANDAKVLGKLPLIGKLADMRRICVRCGSKFGDDAEFCPHDGTRLTPDDLGRDPLIGQLLLEQFRIEEVIGIGGMGTVYRAHQTTVGRDVAVKVLRPELVRHEQAVKRFEREARLATALDHPHLVRVFLSGRLNDGRVYFVMELLEGRSLADELDAHGPLSVERTIRILMKLCAGLRAVHAAGVVHRDIKPDNIYLVERGTDTDFVKVVDFGIARVLEGDGSSITGTSRAGEVFGTAAYISPEAALGEDTDQRSDIYSTGVLAFQMLSGELPFEGSSPSAVLVQHVHEPAPLLRSTVAGARVPEAVANLVMRALSKNPSERQQTLAEFVEELAEAGASAGLLADARTLLLGTMWGDELAAPEANLAGLLGTASAPQPADNEMRLLLDPDDERMLSEAPSPFGATTSHAVRAPRKRSRQGWLWGSLAALLMVLVGFVVSNTWLMDTSLPPTLSSPKEEPSARAASPTEVSTNVSKPEPAPSTFGPPEALARAEEPYAPPKAAATAAADKPKTKREARRRRRTEKPRTKPSLPPQVDSAPRDRRQTAPAVPPRDDGIDWTVPGFPEESTQEVPAEKAPNSPKGEAPSLDEANPPVRPKNPVVIDESPPFELPAVNPEQQSAGQRL